MWWLMARRPAFTALYALGLATLAGCAVIPLGNYPSRGHVPLETISACSAHGSPSRADVLMALGVPNRRFVQDRVFAYFWSVEIALVWIGPGDIEVAQTRALLIEFDRNGAMERSQVVQSTPGKDLDAVIDAWVGSVGPDF